MNGRVELLIYQRVFLYIYIDIIYIIYDHQVIKLTFIDIPMIIMYRY